MGFGERFKIGCWTRVSRGRVCCRRVLARLCGGRSRCRRRFWDTYPPLVIARSSHGAAISASTFQQAASNASQSKTTLVREPVSSPLHVLFAYICIAHRFLGGEEALERHILYSFFFFSFQQNCIYSFEPSTVALRSSLLARVPWVTKWWTEMWGWCPQTTSWPLCCSLSPISKSPLVPAHCRAIITHPKVPSIQPQSTGPHWCAGPASSWAQTSVFWGRCWAGGNWILKSVFFQFPSQIGNANNPLSLQNPGRQSSWVFWQ